MNQVESADRALAEHRLPSEEPVAGRQTREREARADREFRGRFITALVQGARAPQSGAGAAAGATA